MDNDTRSLSPGGCLLAICIFAGAVLGVVFHQISAGILIGCVVGAAVAAALWWSKRSGDRR